MKTGYSFGSLASFVEQINNTTVKLTGDQVIAGSKTFSSNPISSAAQGAGGGYLTRRDFVEAQVSVKANTNSPALTGNPTAPTAAQFDNDTTLATTAFVQRALGNKQGYSYTGDSTLAVSDAGMLVWFAGAGTLVLPPSSSLPPGAEYTIMCTNSGKVITASGDSFYDVFGNRSVGGSLDTLVGDVLSLTKMGDGWQYRGVQIPTAATSNRSTRPANTSFVRNYLEASPQLAGNVHVEGTVIVTQEFQSTNAAGYRIAYGDYGAFWYFDNWNMYLMFTNSGDKWGGFNGLRPFSANCRTGRVTMSNGVSVDGGLIVDDGLIVTGGVTGDSLTVTGASTLSDLTVNTTLHTKGQATFKADLWCGDGVVTGGAFYSPRADTPAFRMTGGTYGTLFYNDGAESFWILCTNANDQYGTYNSLRPFGISKRTGLVQMYNGVTVAAGLWTDQVHISSATNSAPTQAVGTNNTTIATTAFVQSMKIEVAKMLYPVGSYYANDSDSTNPATLFGFGTWVRVEGRVLMGCDNTGAGTFGTPGAQGGALTHTHTAYGTAITIAQMPIHGHSIAMGTSGIGDASGGDGRILTSNVEVKEGVSPATYISANDNGSGQAHTHTIANASSLPPYRVVYLWRRTA